MKTNRVMLLKEIIAVYCDTACGVNEQQYLTGLNMCNVLSARTNRVTHQRRAESVTQRNVTCTRLKPLGSLTFRFSQNVRQYHSIKMGNKSLVKVAKFIYSWTRLQRHRFIRHLAYRVRYFIVPINPLKTKRYLFYIRTQCVPRCKHSTLRL
jgi:hypothetical protein